MKAYLIATATVFGLIIAAHIARLFTHERAAVTQPDFIIATVVSVVLFVWALVLIRREK